MVSCKITLCFCVFQLDPAAYIDTCLYLFCSLPAKEREGAVCDTLASYAQECAQQHIILMWRTPTLCGKGMSHVSSILPCLLLSCVTSDKCDDWVFSQWINSIKLLTQHLAKVC